MAYLEKTDDSDLSPIYKLLNSGNDRNFIDLVAEKYESLGLTKNQFCKIAKIEGKTWANIVEGKHQKIDISILIKLSQFLGIDVKELVQMYISNSQADAIKELEEVKRNSFIANQFDLKGLKKVGFIDAIQDLKAIESRLIEFFQMESIFEYPTSSANPLFSKTKMQNSDKMLLFWNNLVRKQLSCIENPNPFDEERLLSIVPTIREATLDVENGFSKFIRALFDCGVTVVVETYVSKTGIRGGTFFTKEKPYIVLTNLFQRYDSLWFALAHEVCHVIKDLDYIRKQGYHLTGDDDLLTDELHEDIANDFARRLFLSDENAKLIEKYISIDDIVTQYAKTWSVHPSLIYGNYLNGKDSEEWKKFRKQLIPSNVTIKNIEVKDPWMKTNYRETVESMSQTFHRQTATQS